MHVPRTDRQAWLRRVATLLALAMLAGCAALTHSVIAVDGADTQNEALVSRVALSTAHPVLLRAVDEQLLAGVQVPSRIRSFTYVLPPGNRILWLSSVPYGHPFVPQRIRCYVLNAVLRPGSTYELRFDAAKDLPVLAGSVASEPVVEGRLVDSPFILDRSCRWR